MATQDELNQTSGMVVTITSVNDAVAASQDDPVARNRYVPAGTYDRDVYQVEWKRKFSQDFHFGAR